MTVTHGGPLAATFAIELPLFATFLTTSMTMATQQTFLFDEPSTRSPTATAIADSPAPSSTRHNQRLRTPHRRASQTATTTKRISKSVVESVVTKTQTANDKSASSTSNESCSSSDSRDDTLRRLRAQVGCVTTARTDDADDKLFSTGSSTLDALLPNQGLRTDAITEWVADSDGSGAASLAILAARVRLQQSVGPLVIVGGADTFYPPAAIALGIAAERIIWVRPDKLADVVWAIDQALRCPAVAAVWAHVGPNLDDRDARRFQLASETGNTPGLFIRPLSVRGCPSFTDIRFHVAHRAHHVAHQANHVARASDAHAPPLQTNQRDLEVTLDRCRGGPIGQSVSLFIDSQAQIQPHPSSPHQGNVSLPSISTARHETATMRLASELAHPASAKPRKQRRA